MEINGKVHCFFEQSGTFKNEFIKLGIPAEDYDIQNNFGQTDNVMDLFTEIRGGYAGQPSVFDHITSDDLIMAFFPCIYFTGSTNPCYYTLECTNYRKLTMKQKFDEIIKRSKHRNDFYELLYMMVGVCMLRGIRLIIENPYSSQHYLHNNFLKEPSFIDKNRRMRGDYFIKPTGYWFFNCEPTNGQSYTKPQKELTVMKCNGSNKSGVCSQERSVISPDYARNFICDFILGKPQKNSQLTLFDD